MPKGGTPESRVPDRLRRAGAAVGINFSGLTDRYPNTLSTHALLNYAKINAPSLQDKLQEILFRYYFTDGKYSGSEDLSANLEAAAAEAGLVDPSAARTFAEDPVNQQAARKEALANSARGVTGVPFFIINGESVGSGAQPPQVFERLFEEA